MGGKAEFGTTVLKKPELMRGVCCCLLFQQKFLPGLVKNVNVAWFSDSNDDVGPVFVLVALASRVYAIDFLHSWQTSKITNEIYSILLVNEPLLECIRHLLHLISLNF